MDLIIIATEVSFFLVKEFLSEVVILATTERQLGRAEGKGITAYTVQVHCSRLKVNKNFDLPQLSQQGWLLDMKPLTQDSLARNFTTLICFTAMTVDDKQHF